MCCNFIIRGEDLTRLAKLRDDLLGFVKLVHSLAAQPRLCLRLQPAQSRQRTEICILSCKVGIVVCPFALLRARMPRYCPSLPDSTIRNNSSSVKPYSNQRPFLHLSRSLKPVASIAAIKSCVSIWLPRVALRFLARCCRHASILLLHCSANSSGVIAATLSYSNK